VHDNHAAPGGTPTTRGGVPWHHIQFTETCWLWTGPVHKRYGKAGNTTAHRHVYHLLVGDIPEGLELDHLCGKTLCVNPDHLEPVSRAENMRRRYATYTHCSNGHKFTPANTYIRPNGHRDSRACIRTRVAAYKRRQTSRSAA
jgi:hypothetical protein